MQETKKRFRWTSPANAWALEMLHDKLGLWSMERIAAEVRRRSGFPMTASRVRETAKKIGISTSDTHGYFTVRAAAQDLGILESTLACFVKRRGLELWGQPGRPRSPTILPPATMAQARIWYERRHPQFLRPEEVAAYLKKPLPLILACMEDGRLSAVRVLGELRVPVPVVVQAEGRSLAKPKPSPKPRATPKPKPAPHGRKPPAPNHPWRNRIAN